MNKNENNKNCKKIINFLNNYNFYKIEINNNKKIRLSNMNKCKNNKYCLIKINFINMNSNK